MVIGNFEKYRIILASGSPRRQQMLKDAGILFEIRIKDYPEKYDANLKGKEIAEFLAEQKASLFKSEISDNEIIITADTVVWCNNEVLGKPADKDDARHMIKMLSGNTHEVITGVSLLSTRSQKTFSDTTRVTFEKMSDEEIDFYINGYKPFDKAGAYGIQEWIGLRYCSRIEGSYFNVVGLPVNRLVKELKSLVS